VEAGFRGPRNSFTWQPLAGFVAETKEPHARDPAKMANRWLGIVMAVAGIFVIVSLNGALEPVILIGGAVLMLAGLGAILIMFVKQMPASATWLGAAAVGLGALLFVHDLIIPPPFNSIAHAGSGIGVLALGVLQLLGISDLASRFRKRAKPAA